MDRVVYCRNAFVPEAQAQLSIFDRGFLFGDAIYEVTAVMAGRMIDNALHLERLERSLTMLSIPMPLPRAEIEQVQNELIARNNLSEGTIYMQVSRGEAERSFSYPSGLTPNFVAFTQARELAHSSATENGISVQIVDDERWARRDIKTSMLLSQVMAKQRVHEQGYDDAWLVQGGLITEGASSTVFIVTTGDRVVTRPNSNMTLPGCTRKAVLRLCEQHGLVFEERAFSPTEARAAAEAFVTSASMLVTPVVKIGDVVIGTGRPGPLTRKLQSYYLDAARGEAVGA